MKKSALILIMLTLLVVAVQVVHTISTGLNLPPGKIISIIVNGSPTWGLIKPIAFYFIAVTGLMALIVVNALFCRQMLSRWLLRNDQLDLVALVQFSACWGVILILNSWLIPASLFAYDINALFSGWSQYLVFVGLAIGAVVQLLAMIVGLIKLSARPRLTSAFSLVAVAGALILFGLPDSQSRASDTQAQPHVLFIGVDSLRADVFEREDWRARIPNIDHFMSGAVRFETAITPLARTYPAWVSILSGQSPQTSGARINLIDPEMVRKDSLLTRDLKSLGYKTVFATDERRFSNIDESYGFDQIIGPDYGGADFIIGYLSDFPIVNVVSKTFAGEWLFPYIYNNRAIHHNYDPNRFSASLESFVSRADSAHPSFIAAHFCLPHWPYVWSKPQGFDRNEEEPNNPEYSFGHQQYWHAIEEADRQVGALLDHFEREGWLENAIVVLLSDHGEGFGLEADLLEPVGLLVDDPFDHAGHGLNIFSEYQNRIVVGMRYFGDEEWEPGVSQQVMGTIDIRPTINAILENEPIEVDVDGISLVPWLAESSFSQKPRLLEMESGFTVRSFNAAGIDVNSVVNEAISFYSIAGDGRFEIRDAQAESVIQSKQVGLTDGSLVVGAIPNDGFYRWYVADWSAGTIGFVEEETLCNEECESILVAAAERYALKLEPEFVQ